MILAEDCNEVHGQNPKTGSLPGPAPPLERAISALLRAGVAGSLATLLAGLGIMFVQDPGHLRAHADLVRLTRFGADSPTPCAGWARACWPDRARPWRLPACCC